MQQYLIGFDIGGTKCAAILGRKNGDDLQILDKVKFATAETGTPAQCIDTFARRAGELLDRHGVAITACKGIGISCGGPLDSRRGIIQSPPNLPGWDEVAIVDQLQPLFDLPIRLQNDANACAVAEWRYGAGRGAGNLIFLTFGTGLGAGLILNNQLYSGTNDMAGECGHIRLAPIGPVGYGKAGSFEGFCSGGGIAQLARIRLLEALQRGASPSWSAAPELVTAKTVAEAAEAGDELAIAIYRECGLHLGRGLAILIDLLNPEVIVIGSIFARSEQLLRQAMQQAIDTEALGHAARVCRVVPAQLGESIGDIASLALADL